MEAARRLISSGQVPSTITVTDLVSSGACTQKEFKDTYPTLGAFQRDLAAALFDEAREAVIKSTTGLKPGLDQITKAFVTYLDFNLAHTGLQELAHFIQYDPQGWELLMRMEAGVSLITQSDLFSMGANLRSARAKLLTAMTVAVVRAEYAAKKPLPELREAMLDYCRRSAG